MEATYLLCTFSHDVSYYSCGCIPSYRIGSCRFYLPQANHCCICHLSMCPVQNIVHVLKPANISKAVHDKSFRMRRNFKAFNKEQESPDIVKPDNTSIVHACNLPVYTLDVRLSPRLYLLGEDFGTANTSTYLNMI